MTASSKIRQLGGRQPQCDFCSGFLPELEHLWAHRLDLFSHNGGYKRYRRTVRGEIVPAINFAGLYSCEAQGAGHIYSGIDCTNALVGEAARSMTIVFAIVVWR